MNLLLSHTWTLLRQNWILVFVLFWQNTFVMLASGGRGLLGGNPFMTLVLLYAQHIVLGGWLFQMKQVLVDEKPAQWDDFLEGVARYFWPMVTGCSMLIFTFMLFLSLMQLIAGLLYGQPDPAFFQSFIETAQAGKPEALTQFQKEHAQEFEQLLQFGQVFLLGALGFGVFNVLISFWQELCVFGEESWRAAWKNSYILIQKNFKSFVYLGCVWLFPTALIKVGLFTPNPVIGLVAFVLDLVATTYFTLLFCHFLVIVTRPNEIVKDEVE